MSSSLTAHAHQFDDITQQTAAARLGMWAFLATEVMFFGGLFTGYALYRVAHPQAFAEGSQHLDVVLGSINTAVLLVSSFTMALGVRAATLRARGSLAGYLCLTAALGAVFLIIKGIEYGHKIEERLLPGPEFQLEAAAAGQTELFFSFYFGMTAVHALHMAIGVGILIVLALIVWRRPAAIHPNQIEMTGLYWHFVDVIWIVLFPLLYLIGRHT